MPPRSAFLPTTDGPREIWGERQTSMFIGTRAVKNVIDLFGVTRVSNCLPLITDFRGVDRDGDATTTGWSRSP